MEVIRELLLDFMKSLISKLPVVLTESLGYYRLIICLTKHTLCSN